MGFQSLAGEPDVVIVGIAFACGRKIAVKAGPSGPHQAVAARQNTAELRLSALSIASVGADQSKNNQTTENKTTI
jgi:hypothetical protein